MTDDYERAKAERFRLPLPDQRVDSMAAEARAVEYGHQARRQEDGSFLVKSETRERISWRVTYDARLWGGRWLIHFHCDCPSGTARPRVPVPCWHAARVGERLERDRVARWDSGMWWATEEAIRLAAVHARRRPDWFGEPMRGTCRVCGENVTVPMTTGDDRPEDHSMTCRDEWERRAEERSREEHPAVDLWERGEAR